MEYTVDSIFTFVKNTNLSKWFETAIPCNDHPSFEHERQQYAKERPVHLVVQACFKDGATYCRIKCPVNPLPTKGWFQTPNINVLKNHLVSIGWELVCCHGKSVLT